MVKQYQVLLDPVKLAAYGITHAQAVQAIQQANQEAGGSVIEMAEAEYMVRASGYLKTLDDFRAIPLRTAAGGVPVTLGDVATIQTGPEMRRGIAELNGEGEVAGGVVILRSGKNARETIAAVKDKLATLKASLPSGVEIVTTYDRSQLIDRAVDNLTHKLFEEFIAIAIGAMVVMIENAHKKIERWEHDHPGDTLAGETRWSVITDAAAEVGPALFFSLLIITLSFVPVFTLEGQEGRLFAPHRSPSPRPMRWRARRSCR
jgi:Cu(I)/Ag(I) efflux system membrane protein CusA/SilA